MKIILSRKGFDSSNGGCPSPIMPDGTLLSLPIPTSDDVCFSDIAWNGITYADILHQISPKKTFTNCHLDPVYCIIKVPKVAEKNPQSCMRNFPIIASDVWYSPKSI